jgi:phosphoribosylformylglycinamidine synthase PurS subunit
VTRPLRARVEITLKPGIRDPQGQAIENALAGLGFSGLSRVRVGKHITFDVQGPRADAEARVAEACRKLLANPVIEDFVYSIDEDGGP